MAANDPADRVARPPAGAAIATSAAKTVRCFCTAALGSPAAAISSASRRMARRRLSSVSGVDPWASLEASSRRTTCRAAAANGCTAPAASVPADRRTAPSGPRPITTGSWAAASSSAEALTGLPAGGHGRTNSPPGPNKQIGGLDMSGTPQPDIRRRGLRKPCRPCSRFRANCRTESNSKPTHLPADRANNHPMFGACYTNIDQTSTPS